MTDVRDILTKCSQVEIAARRYERALAACRVGGRGRALTHRLIETNLARLCDVLRHGSWKQQRVSARFVAERTFDRCYQSAIDATNELMRAAATGRKKQINVAQQQQQQQRRRNLAELSRLALDVADRVTALKEDVGVLFSKKYF